MITVGTLPSDMIDFSNQPNNKIDDYNSYGRSFLPVKVKDYARRRSWYNKDWNLVFMIGKDDTGNLFLYDMKNASITINKEGLTIF